MKSFATPWYQWRWTSPKPQRFSRVTRSRTTSGDGLWHPQLGMVYEIDTTTSTIIDLVGGFKHVLFSIIYGIILPVDSYFSRWLKPPTSCFYCPVDQMPVDCRIASSRNLLRAAGSHGERSTRFHPSEHYIDIPIWHQKKWTDPIGEVLNIRGTKGLLPKFP